MTPPDSTPYVCLLRGVGGRVQIDSHLLKALLRAEGFEAVRVVGHTGNALLRSDLPAAEVAARAGAALIREAGFYNGLQVVSGDDWAAIVEGNPYPEAAALPGALHLSILGAPPDPRRLEALARLSDGRDGFELRGRAVYLHVPQGFAKSRLAGRFDRGIGVPLTTRGWGTVQRLATLLDAGAAPAPARAA